MSDGAPRRSRLRALRERLRGDPAAQRWERPLKIAAVVVFVVSEVVLLRWYASTGYGTAHRFKGVLIALPIVFLMAMWRTAGALGGRDPYFQPKVFWGVCAALSVGAVVVWSVISRMGGIDSGTLANVLGVVFVVVVLTPVAATLMEKERPRRRGRRLQGKDDADEDG